MKIRLDFVTNSSSSSFLILGVGDDNLVKKLLRAEDMKIYESYDDTPNDNDCCGYRNGKVLTFYGWNHNSYYAGFDNVKEMAEDMTLKQMRQKFIEEIYDRLDVKLQEDDVDLIAGKYGND